MTKETKGLFSDELMAELESEIKRTHDPLNRMCSWRISERLIDIMRSSFTNVNGFVMVAIDEKINRMKKQTHGTINQK